MAKGKRRSQAIAEKDKRKKAAMNHPGGQSKYGRKAKYCAAKGVYGFEVHDPKPWTN
jgi:hypothetical protein